LRPAVAEGFTLVELVAVLSIVGVLAAVAVPRVLDTGSYDAVVARDALVSLFRLGQQRAMSSSGIDLHLSQSGSDYLISVREGGVVRDSLFLSQNDVLLSMGDAANPRSCASLASPREIDFDAAGEIKSIFPAGVQLCVNTVSSICIASSGFAFLGQCE